MSGHKTPLPSQTLGNSLFPNGAISPYPYTILFVDDEEHVLSALCRMFRRENYKVLTAKRGAEALQVLAQESVQVVVADFKMPEMDGVVLLQTVKEQHPETIRIMLTAHADVTAIREPVKQGVVYKFVTKPWNDDDLKLTIKLALEQYELVKENKLLREKKQQAEQKLKNFRRLTSAGRSNLGKVLIRRGVLTSDQLKKAEDIQRQTKEVLPSVLTKLGYIDESEMFGIIKKELNIDPVNPAEFNLSEALFEIVPESYCRQNCVLPLRLEGKQLTLAMADPTDLQKVDDLRFVSGLNIVPVLARAREIAACLDQLASKEISSANPSEEFIEYDFYENIEVIDEDDEYDIRELLSAGKTPAAVQVVNGIISEAITSGASDIHIEPKAKYSRVRFRVDGLLADRMHLPTAVHASTVSRIKVMAGMDISERRKPQDGRVTVRTIRKVVDLRVSSLPTINGEKVVLRILDRNASVRHITEVGIDKVELPKLNRIIKRTQGLLLMVGPTGSGKTTTLYSILRETATVTKNFVTIEDPVEYFMETAEQVHVRERAGLNFASVLRSILRQDPDVIMLGEVRDFDTAEVTFHAALTGHLVLSTLHANDTVSGIVRLRDIGVKSHIIAAGLIGVIGQRLLRRICTNCREEYRPSSEILGDLGLREQTQLQFFRGAGCSHCHNTGYCGRVGIFEILEITDELRELIHGGAGSFDILHAARASGMQRLLEDGYRKINSGISTCEEVLRVLGPVSEIFCPHCHRPVKQEFINCPFCRKVLKRKCRSCGRPMEAEWLGCPFCGEQSGLATEAG